MWYKKLQYIKNIRGIFSGILYYWHVWPPILIWTCRHVWPPILIYLNIFRLRLPPHVPTTTHVWLTLPPHIENKLWISRQNDKSVNIMINTHIFLWKTIESNRRLRVRVMVRFLLFWTCLYWPRDITCSSI